MRTSASFTYLFFFSALEVPPLLSHVTKVDFIHGHLHISDGIVFGEAVKVVYCHHQSLPSELSVGNLRSMSGENNCLHTYQCNLSILVTALISRRNVGMKI